MILVSRTAKIDPCFLVCGLFFYRDTDLRTAFPPTIMEPVALTLQQQHSIATAKALLLASDGQGGSLYDHLQDVIYQMLEDNPNDVVHHAERFAAVSDLVKRSKFVYADPALPTSDPIPVSTEVLRRAQSDAELFVLPKPEVKTVVEQPTPFTTVTTTTVVPPKGPGFASVQQMNKYLRVFGHGLMDQEAFLLDLSIFKLASSKKLEDVRFVGKIFGTKGNYLVVSSRRYVADGEAVYEEVNEMPKPPRKKVDVDIQAEPAYKGANRLSFWVAPNASSEWTLLPDVTPQQVNAARKFSKYLTGDLNAAVVSYPLFPGTERELLRAQLARIVAATYVAPANALEVAQPEEEEEEEEEAEGAKKKKKPAKYLPFTRVNKEYAPDEEAGVSALADLEQWQHAEAYVYETGRCTKVPPKPEVEGEEEEPPAEEEEEEEEKKEEEDKEPFVPVKKDSLYAVITAPKEPNPDDEEDAEAEPAEEEAAEGEEGAKDEDEPKPLEDEDVPDDDPLRKKISAWSTTIKSNIYKKHAVVGVSSLRWPGAFAFAAQQGKTWGCVYFGNGCKGTDHAYTPARAPVIFGEPADMTEVKDPTAANEKLVLRGEEPKEHDSEEEKDPEEEEDEAAAE